MSHLLDATYLEDLKCLPVTLAQNLSRIVNECRFLVPSLRAICLSNLTHRNLKYMWTALVQAFKLIVESVQNISYAFQNVFWISGAWCNVQYSTFTFRALIKYWKKIFHQSLSCLVAHCVNNAVLFCVDTNRNVWGQKVLILLMEKKAHYDSILDRSKRIMWQDDCYVDLQSTSCSVSSQAESEGKSFFDRLIVFYALLVSEWLMSEAAKVKRDREL